MNKFQVFPTREIHLFTALATDPHLTGAPSDHGQYMKFKLLDFYGAVIGKPLITEDKEEDKQNIWVNNKTGFESSTGWAFHIVEGSNIDLSYDSGNEEYCIGFGATTPSPGDVFNIIIRNKEGGAEHFLVVRVFIHKTLLLTNGSFDVYFGQDSHTIYGSSKDSSGNPNIENTFHDSALTIYAKFDNDTSNTTEPYTQFGDITYHSIIDVTTSTTGDITPDTTYPGIVTPITLPSNLPCQITCGVSVRYANTSVQPSDTVTMNLEKWPRLSLPAESDNKSLKCIHPINDDGLINRNPLRKSRPASKFLILFEGFTNSSNDVERQKDLAKKIKDNILTRSPFKLLKPDLEFWYDAAQSSNEASKDSGVSISRGVCDIRNTLASPGADDTELFITPTSKGTSSVKLHKQVISEVGLCTLSGTGFIEDKHIIEQHRHQSTIFINNEAVTSYSTNTSAFESSSPVPSLFDPDYISMSNTDNTVQYDNRWKGWANNYFGDFAKSEIEGGFKKMHALSKKLAINHWLKSRLDGVLKIKDTKFGFLIGHYRIGEGYSRTFRNDFSDLSTYTSSPLYKQENEWFHYEQSDEILYANIDTRRWGAGKISIAKKNFVKFYQDYLSSRVSSEIIDNNIHAHAQNGANWLDEFNGKVYIIFNQSLELGIATSLKINEVEVAYCFISPYENESAALDRLAAPEHGFLYSHSNLKKGEVGNLITPSMKTQDVWMHEMGHSGFNLGDEYEDTAYSGRYRHIDEEKIILPNIVSLNAILKEEGSNLIDPLKIPWNWDRMSVVGHIVKHQTQTNENDEQETVALTGAKIVDGLTPGTDPLSFLGILSTNTHHFDIDSSGNLNSDVKVIEVNIHEPAERALRKWNTYMEQHIKHKVYMRSKDIYIAESIIGRSGNITLAYFKESTSEADNLVSQLFLNYREGTDDLDKLSLMHSVYIPKLTPGKVSSIDVLVDGSGYKKNVRQLLDQKDENEVPAKILINTDDGKITSDSKIQFLPFYNNFLISYGPIHKPNKEFYGQGYRENFAMKITEGFLSKEEGASQAQIRVNIERLFQSVGSILVVNGGMYPLGFEPQVTITPKEGAEIIETAAARVNMSTGTLAETVQVNNGGMVMGTNWLLRFEFYQKYHLTSKYKVAGSFASYNESVDNDDEIPNHNFYIEVVELGSNGEIELITQTEDSIPKFLFGVKADEKTLTSSAKTYHPYVAVRYDGSGVTNPIFDHLVSGEFLFVDGKQVTNGNALPNHTTRLQLDFSSRGSNFKMPRYPIEVILLPCDADERDTRRKEKWKLARAIAYPETDFSNKCGVAIIIDGGEKYYADQRVYLHPNKKVCAATAQEAKMAQATVQIYDIGSKKGRVSTCNIDPLHKGECYRPTSKYYRLCYISNDMGNDYTLKTDSISVTAREKGIEVYAIGQCENEMQLEAVVDTHASSSKYRKVTAINVVNNLRGTGYSADPFILMVGGTFELYDKSHSFFGGNPSKPIDATALTTSNIGVFNSVSNFEATAKVGQAIKGVTIDISGSGYFEEPLIELQKPSSPPPYFVEGKLKAVLAEYERIIPAKVLQEINSTGKGYLRKQGPPTDINSPDKPWPFEVDNYDKTIDQLTTEGLLGEGGALDTNLPPLEKGRRFPIALYEGAGRYNAGVFRSSITSLMRQEEAGAISTRFQVEGLELHREFNYVCKYFIINEINPEKLINLDDEYKETIKYKLE